MAHASGDAGSIGPYRLLGRIGAGGMGVVYRVRRDDSGLVAAMKVFRPARFTRQLLQRFHSEVEALSRLRHPGICQIHEIGTAATSGGPAPYLVMELVEGHTLLRHAAERQLSIRQRVELLLRLCDPLEHAHQKGIIHRDLKPANILVDRSGQPKILDFGIARAIDAELVYTTPGKEPASLAGTLAYMSPEQAARDIHRLDLRSDVYALGVMAYELLGGRLPYELRDRTLQQALVIIRTQPPKPLGEIEPRCQGDLEYVIDKALQKQRQDRYDSARALAEDLRRYLAHQPTRARRPKLWSALDRVARHTREAVDLVGERMRGALHREARPPVADPADTAPPAAPTAPAPAPASSPASPFRAGSSQQRVREGVTQLRSGDYGMALLWFVAALQKAAGDPAESLLRTRIALMLQQSPRLIDVDPPGAAAPAGLAPPERLLEIANDPRANAFIVRMIDLDTSRTLLGPLWHHTQVTQADLVQDGHALATTCRDGTLRLWSSAAQHPLKQLVYHQHAVTCAAFSPAGDVVASGDAGGRGVLMRRGAGLVPLEGGHGSAIRHVSFSPDAGLLVSGAEDGTVRVWEVAGGTAVAAPIQNDQPAVEVQFIRDARQVVVGLSDGSARVWEIATGKAMTPILASGTQVHRALMRQARATAPVELSPGHGPAEVPPALARLISSVRGGGNISQAALARDGTVACTVSDRGAALLWDVAGELPLSGPLDPEHRATVTAISPDGALLLVGSTDGTTRLFSLAPTSRPVEELKMIAEALSCHLIDEALGLYPLSSADWRAAWGRSASYFRT